jgi:O-antigen ligase
MRPRTTLLSVLLLMGVVVATPIFLYVLLGKWADSPLRQVVGFGALFGLFALAFVREKASCVGGAVVFLSQFLVSLLSFELTPPVVQTVLLSDVLLVLMLAATLEARQPIRVRGLVAWLFLALVAWQAAVTPLSAHPVRSTMFTIEQGKFVLLYLLFSNLRLGDRAQKSLPLLVAAVLLIQAGINLAQYFTGGYLGLNVLGERDPYRSELHFFEGFLRPSGTLGSTNAMGGYFSMLLVFLLPYLIARPGVVLLGIYAIGLWGFVVPLTRAGWLSFTFGAGIVGLHFVRGRIVGAVKLIAMGFVAVTVIVAVAYVNREAILGRFTDQASVASAEGRVKQFPYTIAMAMKNPVVGIGPGISTFYGSWNDFDRFISSVDKVRDVSFNEQPHNSFLQYLVESGLPGAGLFTAFFVAVLINSLRRPVAHRDIALVQIGAGAAAITYLVLTQFGTEINSPQMWTLFAAMLGLATNRHMVAQDR